MTISASADTARECYFERGANPPPIVVAPPATPDNDHPVSVPYGGLSAQAGVLLAVKK